MPTSSLASRSLAVLHSSWEKLRGDGQPWTFRRRRVVASAVVMLSIGVVAALTGLAHAAMLRTSVMTGWTLMACLFGLVTIGMRRRLPMLPLGNVSTWTQIHVYTGLFACGVFVMHVPRIIATGWLEGGLSWLFLIVSGSGIYGMIASRRLPPRLSVVDGQHRFDQVHWHRLKVADAAQEVVSNLQGSSATEVIGEFYGKYLESYFRDRPSLTYLAFPTSIRSRRLLIGLKNLDRYLEDEGRQASGLIASMVRRRDDLDYQFALQFRLRVWVLVHAVLSLALISIAVIHGILALRFIDAT